MVGLIAALYFSPIGEIKSVSVQPTLTPSPIPLPSPHIFTQEKLWEVVNDWRVSQGKPAYKENPWLCSIAEKRMVEIQKDWSHDGIQRRWNKDMGGFVWMGENLGKEYLSEERMLISWLASPTHRKNLDQNFTHSCIRCQMAGVFPYCVQLFGRY